MTSGSRFIPVAAAAVGAASATGRMTGAFTACMFGMLSVRIGGPAVFTMTGGDCGGLRTDFGGGALFLVVDMSPSVTHSLTSGSALDA